MDETIWYTCIAPEGKEYVATTSASPTNTKIAQFAERVMAAKGFVGCTANVFPSRAATAPCNRSWLLQKYINSGTKTTPFHLQLQRIPGQQLQANGMKRCGFEDNNMHKKHKVMHTTFKKSDYNFTELVNSTINNKKDAELYEFKDHERRVLESIDPTPGTPKPRFITLWSARGTGKTALLRQIALHSTKLAAQRNCGRLMVVKASVLGHFVGANVKALSSSNIHDVIPSLVALHLCKVFGSSWVNGVQFSARATFADLWNRSARHLPPTLLSKLESTRGSAQAYEWWYEFTKILGDKGDRDDDPVRPIILMDSAKDLAKKSYGRKQKKKEYHLLEEIMVTLPVHHALIAFGTGAANKHRPKEFQAKAIHIAMEPLAALSLESARKLLQKTMKKSQARVPMNEREFKITYTATSGVPRMLIEAFQLATEAILLGTNNEQWEKRMATCYQDADDYVQNVMNGKSSLAKAIIICAVSDVPADSSENTTWDELRWRSILFAVSSKRKEDKETYWRIPRFLWSGNCYARIQLEEFVWNTCHFSLGDLVPTLPELYPEAGNEYTVASGKAWQKLFASALVARFFVCCWKEQKDPHSAYITLKQLLPQMNAKDNLTLDTVEVSLGNGIVVAEKEQTCETNAASSSVNWKAVHANWNIKSPHHDLILPVRCKGSEHKKELWAISAGNGSRKGETEMTDMTGQHLKPKLEADEVAGLIQAVSPRSYEAGDRGLKGKLLEMEQNRRYAEVTITEGQAHSILCCLC